MKITKKIIKIIEIVFVNIMLAILLLVLIDYIIFKMLEIKYPLKEGPAKFGYLIEPPTPDVESTEIFFTEHNKMGVNVRKPDGLEFSKKKPLLLFGCSYAYGFALNQNQTLSYKLAHILKKPVYNRAVTGNGFQLMYIMSTKDRLYKDLPTPDTVMYVMLNDHFRRMLGETFDIRDRYFYPYFEYKNGDLIYDNHKNKILNFLKSSYLTRLILKNKIICQLNDYNNADYLTDFALAYFVKTREQLEKRYNTKLKFYVVLFDVYLFRDMLKEKLKQNGFEVIDVKDFSDENFYSDKYFSKETIHPREITWDVLTPEIAKRMK
ncbi:MAG: hypothetical protein ACI37Z_04795 [Candidatus Gastranaerophilaceae bacterium]